MKSENTKHDIYKETETLVGFINSPDGVSMAQAMVKLPLVKRRKLLALARVMARDAERELLPHGKKRNTSHV